MITGMGALTSLGATAHETWHNALAGMSGVKRVQRWDPSQLPAQIAGEILGDAPLPWLDRTDARSIARFARFAVVASAEALGQAGLLESTTRDPRRSGVIIGTAAGGMDIIAETTRTFDARGYRRISPFFMTTFPHNMGTYHVAKAFRCLGPSSTIATACATGAQAIGEAAEVIRRGQADVMVAGGAEFAVHPLFFASFAIQQAATTLNEEPERASRPFDAERAGFVIGDGAGVMVLESLAHAMQRGATILGEVVGSGTSNDGFHAIAPEPEGRGAALAIELALNDAGLPPTAIDYVNAHAASTPLGDAAETAAIKLALGEEHARRVPISSLKSMTGHLMGATGAVESVVTMMSMQHGKVPPTINLETPDPLCDLDYVPNVCRAVDVRYALKNSFGLGGQNAVLIFRRWDDGDEAGV